MCYTLHTHREEMRGGNKVGYAVVHMMKIKSGAVGGIQSHNNREHEPKTNPDVDMSRSEDNYDLIPCDNYKRSIKEKLSNLVESGRAVRKDAVVVCNFIVTSDNETMDALRADRQREFFQDSVKWFSDRYGADRVLNATVHMDETTPHLHIGVMPITQDGRLSAKAIFTKTEMKAIQTEFARDVGEKYGFLERLDSLTEDEDNHFTREDVKDALKALKADNRLLSTMASREWIEKQTKVPIPPNKRNGRKQAQHLQLARGIRQIKGSMGEAVSGGGRPEMSKIVEEWRKAHPDGRKAECIKETGLSKPTVYKWWK